MVYILNEQEQRKLAKGKCPHCGGPLKKIDPGMRYHFYLECRKCTATYYCNYPDVPVRMDFSHRPLSVFWRELSEKGVAVQRSEGER